MPVATTSSGADYKAPTVVSDRRLSIMEAGLQSLSGLAEYTALQALRAWRQEVFDTSGAVAFPGGERIHIIVSETLVGQSTQYKTYCGQRFGTVAHHRVALALASCIRCKRHRQTWEAKWAGGGASAPTEGSAVVWWTAVLQ